MNEATNDIFFQKEMRNRALIALDKAKAMEKGKKGKKPVYIKQGESPAYTAIKNEKTKTEQEKIKKHNKSIIRSIKAREKRIKVLQKEIEQLKEKLIE